MDRFESVSEYQPTGDQPKEIAELVKASSRGINFRHRYLGLFIPYFVDYMD